MAVDLSTECNEQDRTYVVSFTIAQGDEGSYEIIGPSGVLSTEAPFVFTSDPIVISQPFVAFLRDANACGEVRVEAASPCSFDSEVFVPGSFSPNGDGINETFIIPGIEGYPTNNITIFNRWGNEVFNGAGYDNRTVVWDGSSPDALLPGSAPTGTYFYVLDLGLGSEPITGFIQLVR
jgi:gliding motility-associated-like protein